MTQGLCMFDRECGSSYRTVSTPRCTGFAVKTFAPACCSKRSCEQRLEAGNQPVGGSQAFVAESAGNGHRRRRRSLSWSR